MSVRELVDKARMEVLAGELQPIRVGELASELSALLGNIFQEIREADMAFNAVYAACLDQEGKANRAKIRAELTPEYQRKREAHDYHAVTLELVRSLRKLQDSQIGEMRLSR